MKRISEQFEKKLRPERVIQFGEGGFLRGFVDWMLQKLNDHGSFDGSVVVVQPIPQGLCGKLSEQNNLYTHVIRGVEGVEKQVVDVISRCVNPYEDYEAYLALADDPGFRFIVSNTTEAGIAYREAEALSDAPHISYPAKLTALLYRRYKKGLGGFILLPCELIDRNGDKLREIVLRYAREWALGDGFEEWIRTENHFCTTLVDRIVTGRPVNEDMELGYEDGMVNTSEYFHLWVIEADPALARELPFHEIGLNVIWTENLEPYRTRKVRILNGAHTSLTPFALLKGFDTVKSCMDDPDMYAYVRRCVFEEIIPTLDLPREELIEYAEDVLKRFSNGYIRHYLSSIALNSVSKFKVRVLPSLLEYIRRNGSVPPTLTFSLGALIKFYRQGTPNDDPQIVQEMRSLSTAEILARTDWWGEDLTFLLEEVAPYAD